MGYCVEYILDVLGADFAKKLPHGVISDRDWEGVIPNSSGELLGQTDGLVTRLSYAEIKYSWIIGEHGESNRQVELMDVALAILFPSKRLLRLDELLLDRWVSRHNDEFHKSSNAFEELLQWLTTQDTLHWKHFPNLESAE